MEGIQGAILRVKLRHLEKWTEPRRAHARRYDAGLAGAAVERPVEAPGRRHVYHVYAVRTRDRAGLRSRWRRRASRPASTIPCPSTCSRPTRTAAGARARSRTAERAADEVLSLPMYPEMTPEHVDAVCRAVHGG